MSIYDDGIGYLTPWLVQDVNKYLKANLDVSLNELAKRCGYSYSGFRQNFTSGLSPSVRFLAKYAEATGRDIPSFFADVGSIVNLQLKGIQPYGDKPERLISTLKDAPPMLKKDPGKKVRAYEKARPVIEEWRKKNPKGKQSQCVRETGLSKSAVSRNWNSEFIQKRKPRRRYG